MQNAFNTSNQIILVSANSEIVEYCRDALGRDFELKVLKKASAISSAMSALSPVMIVDCVSVGVDLQSDVKEYSSFRGDVLLLVYNLPFANDELHRLIPRGTFILFPCDFDYLHSIVSAKIKDWSMKFDIPMFNKNIGEHGVTDEDVQGFEKIIGSSKLLYETKRKLSTIATKDVTLLLVGESGTGKTLVAELVHLKSNRCDKKFVAVNMSTVQESLAESELFGVVKGAYTGAVNRGGLFVEANGGTLFMDEIGEIPLSLQAKLLTVLDSGKFYSVGSDKETKVDVRIICATNANLESLVRAGKFRKDLYYRIAKVKVEIPPLRERPEDVAPIVLNYLKRHNKQISDDAMKKLEQYVWKGNVRELENCLEIACVFSDGEILQADDFNLSAIDDAPDIS